jgi:anti-sigma regulatory factor (Ser/Thr protein kinase)
MQLTAELPAQTSRIAGRSRRENSSVHCCESDHELHVSFQSQRCLTSTVVGLLLEFCERKNLLCERERIRSAVALEEALLNAVIHGNLEVTSRLRDRDDGSFEKLIELRRDLPEYKYRKVDVTLRYSTGDVSFTIRDQGSGFDVNAVPDPRDSESITRNCGRGLLLMRSFMDQVRFNDAGNEVTLVKFRPAPAQPV